MGVKTLASDTVSNCVVPILEKIANLPPQPVILSAAKNPAYGAKALRFAQGDKTEFCNCLMLIQTTGTQADATPAVASRRTGWNCLLSRASTN